jgi:hypothetical protein
MVSLEAGHMVLAVAIGLIPVERPPEDYARVLTTSYKTVPQDLIPTMRLVFEPKGIRVRSRTVQLRGEKRTVLSEQTLWFSQGDLVILHKPIAKGRTQDLALDNFVTSKGRILYWKHGSKEGERLLREAGDTLWFTRYALDPGWIMAGIQEQFQEHPELFQVTVKNNVTTAILRKTNVFDSRGREIAFGVSFSENPLWFTRLHVIGDRHIIIEHDKPEPIDKIPFKDTDIPSEIDFRDSTMMLRHFMPFL